MCHLILVLPILGLGVFWFWPLSVAVPVYALVVVVSMFFYYYIVQAMRRPVVTGAEEILQSTGKVIDARAHKICVRVHGEVWCAESPDKLQTGDSVTIAGLDGLILRVRRDDNGRERIRTVQAES